MLLLIYPCLVTGRWSSLVTPVSSTNKTDLYDIIEILLKVALSTITLTHIYVGFFMRIIDMSMCKSGQIKINIK
jgi:cytochrome b subunit of formate dehydrogenase